MSCCPNCGLDTEAGYLGEIPVEDLVTEKVRQTQLDLLRQGIEARHSHCIASSAPLRAGGREFRDAS